MKILDNCNFRSKRYTECGLRVYWLKINQFALLIFMKSFLPNFVEMLDLKNTNDKITLELNDLSSLFFNSIYCLLITLTVFIYEITIFFICQINSILQVFKRLQI